MGQPVVVSRKSTRDPKVVRFEANRLFTGSGHERYANAAGGVRGNTPGSALANRLFATGKVNSVHLFGNLITVELVSDNSADTQTLDSIEQIIRDLYQYWKPGMEPPSFEDFVAEEQASAPAGDSGAASGPAVDSRVPAHLLERSAAARARWAAKNG